VDVTTYISSGILEAYALGSLTPAEMTEVAANVARHPELRTELEAIEAALIAYAAAEAPALPAGLENKIWNELSGGTIIEATAQPKGNNLPFDPQYRKPALEWKYAAAIALLVSSLAFNVYQWTGKNNSTGEFATLTSRIDSLSTSHQQLAQEITSYRKAKDMMSDTAMQTIVMHTMQKGHPMAATLYWSKDKGLAYVSVNGLPAPPPGMQYQLWAIKDGKPVDLGVLPNEMANTPSIMKVEKPMPGGEAFAISLEKQGGSPVPTMQNIYVLGKA
jgi:anti-sigma-K factor RskA